MGVARFRVLAFLLAPLASCEDLFNVPGAEEVQPNAPSRFTSVDYTDGVLTLRWQDASNVETGYAVERSESMGGDDYVRFDSLAADSEEFQVGITKPARFRVAVMGGSGPSAYLSACLYYEDLDGDGSGTNLMVGEGDCPLEHASFQTGDCDGENPTRFPGNKDICDGIDNDCDDIVDDGTVYYDGDGDGHGTPPKTAIRCSAPQGYVPSSDDCDDSDKNNFPGNPEACDGKDSNCDGIVDGEGVCTLPLVARLPYNADRIQCAAAANRKIYCFGWNSIMEFDPLTKAVATKSVQLPSPRDGLSCAAVGQRIYCFGGARYYYEKILLDQIVEYDPVSDRVATMTAVLPSPLEKLSCAAADNGKIYCFGGNIGWPIYLLDQIVEYDPSYDTASIKAAKLPSAREDLSCTTARGNIYCFGGDTLGYDTDQIVEYDPSNDTASIKAAKLPSAREGLSCATVASSRIYCFGGLTSGGFGPDQVLEYNIDSDTLATSRAKLPSGRERHSCAEASGSVYCFGGAPGAGSNTSPGYQIVNFDPQKFPLTTEKSAGATARLILPNRPMRASGLPMDPASDGPTFGCAGEPIGSGR